MDNYTKRKKLLEKFQVKRKRDLITLVTSTKQPEEHFGTQIAMDVLPILYSLMKGKKQEQKKIDLFLYSSGGQIDAPWAIVSLIREYYDNLSVIVPSRAHSAGTLIVLGADSIEMSPMGTLSPIDPQLTIKQPDKSPSIQAGIEDIYGYYLLIKDTLELDAAGKTEALKLLANRIGPEILGQASRIRNEIKIIATNLLKLHMKDEQKIETIVSNLIDGLQSHQYMISRKEARTTLGLPVNYLNGELEDLAWTILDSYVSEAKMDEPGLSPVFKAGETKSTTEINRAFVENSIRSFVFKTQYTAYKDGKIEKRINKWIEAK